MKARNIARVGVRSADRVVAVLGMLPQIAGAWAPIELARRNGLCV